MSITDEDLQFMADAMRENSLYSMDGDLDFAQLLPPDDVDVTANESDALLERKSKAKTKSPTAATPQVAGKAKSKEKARDKSGVATGDAAKNKETKDRAKMPPPQSTSPMSDVYLSSLPDTLVKPKVDGKLSKSMKGASQNGKSAPEADMSFALDPYGIPTSPASKLPSHGTPAQKTNTASTVAGVAKMTSPLALIPASDKKRLKPQKRVAKRSFLDAPEAPEIETEMRLAQVQPPRAKPPPKAAAKPKKKAPVGKGKEKEKKEKEAEPAKPTAKPKPKPTKTIAKVDKQDKQDSRTFLVPKPVKEEDSPYDIPAAVADVLPSRDITKKLRPRTEKPAIIISSDSESSYLDDDSASFAGNTTIMTTPDHAVEDFSLTKLQRQKTQMAAVPVVETKGLMVFGKSNKRPADRAAVGMADRQTKVQRQADASDMYSVADNDMDAPSTSYEVKSHMGGLHLARGPEAFVSEQGSIEQTGRQERRQRSPINMYGGGQRSKRPTSGRSLDADRDHDDGDADSDHAMLQSQGSSSKVVHSVAASDPFLGDLDEERPQQSQFTSKLFRSTRPAYEIEQWQSSRPANCQPRYSTAINTPRAERDAPVSHMSHASHVPHGMSDESNHIAREMMQLLTSGRRAEPGRGQAGGSKSAKDIWLDETDPYKETTQVMGYVCKTLLRYLKSKEAAVDDVAVEYRQRGGAVLTRIKELHGNEKRRFALEFEGQRQKSLEVFEEACRAVRKISGSLERVSLVPAINDVLADNTITRLRALQAEVV